MDPEFSRQNGTATQPMANYQRKRDLDPEVRLLPKGVWVLGQGCPGLGFRVWGLGFRV